MHIILGTENATAMREKYIVLELETLPKGLNGEMITAYCVVQPESIAFQMGEIDRLGRLHQATVDAYNRKDYANTMEGISHLKGNFGGEVDSFYEIIAQRITELTCVE